MINLLVIDDHPVTIFGVKNYLEDSIRIIYSATTIKDSLNFDPNKFDIILLDLYIEGTNPIDNVVLLKSVYNKPIVIFTCEASSAWRKKMYKYGIQAYITKTSNKNQILFTLEMIMNNL